MGWSAIRSMSSHWSMGSWMAPRSARQVMPLSLPVLMMLSFSLSHYRYMHLTVLTVNFDVLQDGSGGCSNLCARASRSH